MQKILKNLNIDFMKWRRQATVFSLAMVLASVGSLLFRGLNFGIDFTGGMLVEVGYEQPVDLVDVRKRLDAAAITGAVAQHFGSSRDVLVRIPPQSESLQGAALSDRVFHSLSQDAGQQVDLRRVEFVGPQVGEELSEDGGLAVIYALIGILIYVALRFEYRFAFGSVIALIHDVAITLGLFSLLQIEFDLPVLAAVLAVIGYSLNDTIVIFDRIRENFRKVRKGTTVDVLNRSLNETMSRTLVTSGTTLLVVLTLFLLGGEIIHGFAFALLVGILVGTYSSIYVASTSVLAMGVSKADLLVPEKEGAGAQL